MACLFLESFDKYGSANTNSAGVAALLTAGEWSSTTGPPTLAIVAGLSATGYALQITGAAVSINKTLPGSYARLIGGLRFSSTLAGVCGIQFIDVASNQAGICINSAGTIAVRSGSYSAGTILGTSTATITASSVHYLEWDITFNNAGSYQLWLDGVSILSGSGDTTNTANSSASGLQVIAGNVSVNFVVDDLYLFDASGSANNAVLLTSPRIETQFPTGDGSTVQFAAGAAIVGSSVSRIAAAQGMAVNQMRLRPVTPAVNCTINAVSISPVATNASIQLRPVIYSDSAGLPNSLMSAGSTVTGITPGTHRTMPLTTPQALTAGTQYWIGVMNDIVLASSLSGLDGTNTDRTVTASFASGAPGTASGTAAAVAAVIWGNVTASANWYTQQSPPQGSQSYVFEANVGEEDLYSYPALSATPSAIYTVAVKASVSKSDAGAKTVSLRMKSGATDSGGSAGALAPGTGYGWLTTLFPTDPATAAAWTLAALNAAQSGVKVES